MKKTVLLILTIAILFSLCSCKVAEVNLEKESSKHEKEVSKIENKILDFDVYHKEYSDSNGRTCVVIDINYPIMNENCEYEGKEKFNSYFADFCNNISENAKANVEGTADTMDRWNFESPLVKKYIFSLYDITDSYVSFLVEEYNQFSTPKETDEPNYLGFTFLLETGERLTTADIATNFPATKDALLAKIVDYSNSNYSPNGYELGDELTETLLSYFDENSFLVSNDGIRYVFSYNYVSGGSLKGVYYALVTWEDFFSLK